jgi:aspartokinase-like uncharacterized kinase
MWIIKLSGSLLGTPELSKWLDIVERNGDGKVIIAPGGGMLADVVHLAQQMTGIDDAYAHRMAVLAMTQYGVLMRGINPKLVEASTELELAERGWQHRGIVWLPSHMVHTDDMLPKHRDMRSDSLSAWLAHRMQAQHLVMVDSVQYDTKTIDVSTLVSNGRVDPYFPNFIRDTEQSGFSTWLLDKQFFHLFNQSFDTGILAEHAVAVI